MGALQTEYSNPMWGIRHDCGLWVHILPSFLLWYLLWVCIRVQDMVSGPEENSAEEKQGGCQYLWAYLKRSHHLCAVGLRYRNYWWICLTKQKCFLSSAWPLHRNVRCPLVLVHPLRFVLHDERPEPQVVQSQQKRRGRRRRRRHRRR